MPSQDQYCTLDHSFQNEKREARLNKSLGNEKQEMIKERLKSY